MPFQLTILGTSSASPTSNRYPTAQVLQVLGRFFLIDCGEGTQTQLRKYNIGFSRIDHIFISHLHGDHIFGLIGLISTMIMLGRNKDLHIYAHSELQRFISFQLNFLYPNFEAPFNLIFHPLNFKKEQLIFEDTKVNVFSFPLFHRIPTCGFRIEEKPALPNLLAKKIEQYKIPIVERQRIKEGGDFTASDGTIILHKELTAKKFKPRSFAFCSDTAYNEKYIDSVRIVDLLYHEATFAENNRKLADETYHSTGKDAATVASKADAGQLILGHFSARYKNFQPILDEALAVFPNTHACIEGDVFSIEKSKLSE